MSVTLNDKPLKKLQRTLKRLTGAKIKVGFFDGDVASYAAFQEFGTLHIPARPFIRSTIEVEQGEIKEAQALVMKGVFEGKFTAKQAAQALGDFIRRLILKRIDNASSWAAPLEESTIAKKGSADPLIDTGRMRDTLIVKVEL